MDGCVGTLLEFVLEAVGEAAGALVEYFVNRLHRRRKKRNYARQGIPAMRRFYQKSRGKHQNPSGDENIRY